MVAVKENEAEGSVWDSNRELPVGEQNPISIKRCLRNHVTCGLGRCDQSSEGQACVTMLRNVHTVCKLTLTPRRVLAVGASTVSVVAECFATNLEDKP